MYYLTDFCCICFYNKEHLQLLSDSDSANITLFFKLTSCVPEMCFNGMNDQRFVCNKCCETIDAVYMFRQRCLRSKNTLTDYISQLHQISKISGTANVYLTDINKFGDMNEEYPKENNIEKTEMFMKLNEDTSQEENIQINAITEFKTENNPTSLKLIETEDNFIQFENVIIKVERENQNSEENFDNILINQDENKIDVSQNDVNITAIIKKENENQDFEEHLQERCVNILETCDSENDYMETTEKDNYDYSLHSENCTDNISTNLDEIKIDIVDNAIELANKEINIKCKSEVIEKFSTEVKVTPLKDQVKDKADKACSVCQKKFTHSSTLKKHLKIHTGVKPHECSVCQKKFTHSFNLRTHMRIHTGVKPHECSVCQKKFTRSSDLERHMIIHTGVKPHECSVCQKKFTHLFNLKVHMKIHTGIKAYECSVCQKKFTYSSCLIRHTRIHTEVKPHECSVCQKKFTHSSNLKVHMKIHTGIKEYECGVCQKKFIRSFNLRKHMRIHTGVKTHECSVCQKKFIESTDLRRHMRIHTEVKPHECSVCQKKFTQSSSLKRHMRIHIGVKPHE